MFGKRLILPALVVVAAVLQAAPAQSNFIVDMMPNNVRASGTERGLDMPTDETPLADKTPTGVHEQATMILYLLEQVKLPDASAGPR